MRYSLACLATGLCVAFSAPAAARLAPPNNAIHALTCKNAVRQASLYFRQAYTLVAGSPFVPLAMQVGLPTASRAQLVRIMRLMSLNNHAIAQVYYQLPAINDDVQIACSPQFRKYR